MEANTKTMNIHIKKPKGVKVHVRVAVSKETLKRLGGCPTQPPSQPKEAPVESQLTIE